MNLSEICIHAADRIRAVCPEPVTAGLILGSGLGGYADLLEDAVAVSYSELEGFPVSTVPGHSGRFVIGTRCGRRVIAMQGRFHFYEGFPQEKLGLGVRVMRLLGAESLLLTNAAGGIDLSFQPGDLMLITDHINFARVNPLIGPNDDAFGPRFPDQSNVYDAELRGKILAAASAEGIELKEGVYMMFSGPCFETPAEIRMARILGASAAGMSTVPEAITASHCGMRVAGISLITNMAAGILDRKLTHAEVLETADLASKKLCRLTDAVLRDVF